MKYLPKKWASRWTGTAMKWEGPSYFQKRALKAFVKVYGIDVNEAELSLEEYRSINQFFTRKLKPGARQVQGEIVHPADGLIISSGSVLEGQIFQVKGLNYDLASFLGDAEQAQRFEGGTFWTLYLSPRDYHRVHFPVSGEVTKVQRIQGQLWPVSAPFYKNFADLFVENERVVVSLKTPKGTAAVVMVGATNVGHIEVPLEGQGPKDVLVGDELGAFHFGSTVVILLEAGMALPPVEGKKVLFGQSLEAST